MSFIYLFIKKTKKHAPYCGVNVLIADNNGVSQYNNGVSQFSRESCTAYESSLIAFNASIQFSN